MSTESDKEYSLNWKNHMIHVRKAFDHLFNTNELTDVTLYCDGKKIGAHKMLLSACSTYFRDVFKDVPCQHPVIIMQGIEYGVLSDILHFIYNGEVNVDPSKLDAFLKSAQVLQISGLTDFVSVKEETVEEPSNDEEEEMFIKSMTCAASINDNEKKVAKRSHTDETNAQNSKRQREEDESFFLADVKCESSELVNFEDPLVDPLVQNEQADTHAADEDYKLHSSEEMELSDDATSSNDMPVGLLEDANAANNSLLPEKSKITYEKAYLTFREWCSANGVKKICEDVILAFLEQKSKSVKPMTLWSTYSMLKAMLSAKDGIDLRTYPKLIPFLKRKNVGYIPTKPATLTKEEIDKFINEADDKTYLLIKTVLIMGIAGACSREELVRLTIDNIEDVGHILIVKVFDTKTQADRTFMITKLNYIEIYRKYRALRPAHASSDRLFLKYLNGKCCNQNVGIHKIAEMPSVIAKFLGRKDFKNFTGHCFRRSSIAL